MYCKNCGKEIKEGNTFCTHCGLKVGEEPSKANNKHNHLGILILVIIIVIVGLIIGSNIIISNKSKNMGKNIDYYEKTGAFNNYIKNDESKISNNNTIENQTIISNTEKNKNTNNISQISMEIYIDESGNAQVIEQWNCNTNTGTEIYHPYSNLGKSQISNLVVSDNNKTYTTLKEWNTTGSLDDKAYNCGINYTNNSAEICWGISNYGINTYNVKYTISNFVAQLEDSQMIYWTLIPYNFSTPIGKVKVKIYTNKYFDDTTKLWGYGNYGGTCKLENGCIYLESNGSLTTSESIILLAKLPQDMFNTDNKLDNNFSYYYNMAEQGAKH